MLNARHHGLFIFHLARCNPRCHIGQKLRLHIGMRGDNEATNRQLLTDNLNDIIRSWGGFCIVVLADHATNGHTSEWPREFDRGLKMIAANIIEIDIDAFWRHGAQRG